MFFKRRYDPSSRNRLLWYELNVLLSSYLGTSVMSPGFCQRSNASRIWFTRILLPAFTRFDLVRLRILLPHEKLKSTIRSKPLYENVLVNPPYSLGCAVPITMPSSLLITPS